MTASAMDTVGGATAVFPASHAHAGDVVINMPSDDVVDKTTLVRQEEPSQPVQPEHAALEETKGGDLTEQQADDADTIPPTVTVLRKATGEEVYIVGTVHFSHKSCEDVAKTIRLVKPDVVVLELCHSRVSILAAPEDHVPDAEFSFSEVQRVLREGRGAMGVMQLLLYSLSAKLSKDLGITPGREFRVALAEARRLQGCRVVLGDRPIQVTLQRTLACLSGWQKLKLAYSIVRMPTGCTAEDVERFKERDILGDALAELTRDYPAVFRTIVSERDQFLAHTVRSIGRRVVAVVGMGHVEGIVRNWDQDIDIGELLQPASAAPPQPSLLYRVFRAGVIGIGAWFAITRLRRFR